jgi:dienelactone hydrolase
MPEKKRRIRNNVMTGKVQGVHLRIFWRANVVSIAILALFFFSGCLSVPSSSERLTTADTVASKAGFTKELVKTDTYILTSFSRISQKGAPVTVYIEGDGYAWVTSSRPSGDPTPRDPLTLKLAVQDPAANVVYLARPCQFTPAEKNPVCEEFYWTAGRFSEEVIKSMDQAVSYFVQRTQASGVDLIGYSGGAAVAILVAARRQDIKSFRTVAGNLDPELVNRTHGVSFLEGSLDPLEAAPKTASTPQLHFIGGDDEVIPFGVLESFSSKLGGSSCFHFKTIPEATHNKGWVESWNELVRLPVSCSEGKP